MSCCDIRFDGTLPLNASSNIDVNEIIANGNVDFKANLNVDGNLTVGGITSLEGKLELGYDTTIIVTATIQEPSSTLVYLDNSGGTELILDDITTSIVANSSQCVILTTITPTITIRDNSVSAGNIYLANNEEFTMNANDRLTLLKSQGSSWYEVNRSYQKPTFSYWDAIWKLDNVKILSQKNAFSLGNQDGWAVVHYFTENVTITHVVFSVDDADGEATFIGNISVGIYKNGATINEQLFGSGNWTAVLPTTNVSVVANTYVYKFNHTDTSFVEGDYVEIMVNIGGSTLTGGSEWIARAVGYSQTITI